MTELKTLKDIWRKVEAAKIIKENGHIMAYGYDPVHNDIWTYIVNGEELKAEAIKWVKEDIKNMRDMEPDDYLFVCADARVEFIVDFFNLTEEDLK